MSTAHQTTDDAIFQHPFARPLWESLIICNGGMCDRYMTEDQLLAQARAEKLGWHRG